MSKKILTEGGLAGHIMHLYEDLTLPFGKLKEIAQGLSDGSIQGTEKLDGYNVFMTMRNGECHIARNKSEIAQGGIDIEQLSNKDFSGGSEVARIFWEAAQVFENAFMDFSKEESALIFGEQGNVFFSFEIITKDEQNLIQYDSNMLVLLPVGHIVYDFSKNETNHNEAETFYEKLIEKMDDLNEISKDLSFTFSVAPKLSNESPELFDNFSMQLTKLQKEANLSDFSKIKELYKFNIKKNLSKLNHFDIQKPEIKDMIADLVLGDKKTSDIPSNFNETDRDFIAMFSKTGKNAKKILEISKWPLEKIIHDFSVAYLNQIENHEERLNDNSVIPTLKKAIKAIKAYDGEDKEEAMAVLNKNLSKISSFDEINEYIEGLVFEYNGKIYKLTGNFAPINQIVGLYKYGRGKIPALCFKGDENALKSGEESPENGQKQELEEEDGNFGGTAGSLGHAGAAQTIAGDASVALFAGSFKPPHAGHYKAVLKLLDAKNPNGEFIVKKMVILISPKPRYSNDYKIFVDAEKSEEVWRMFLEDQDRIEIKICEKSPVQEIYDTVKTDEHGDQNYIIVTSQKDKGENRYDKLKSYAPDKTIKLAIVPNFNEIDATKVRQCLATNDYESFVNFMPMEIDRNVMKGIWSTLKNQSYNSMYDKFSQDINSTPMYSELAKRYPTMIKDRKFVSDLVLKEETKKLKDRIAGNSSNPEKDRLIEGIKVEMEHTNDMLTAKKIAMDHLSQDPKYYDKLAKANL